MTHYPLIRMTVRHGRQASWITGCLACILTVVVFFQFNSIWLLVLGLLLSIGIGVFLRLLAEIVEVVADALLPR
jgi:hypothetical protein